MKNTIITTAITLSLVFLSANAFAGGGKTKPKFMSFKQHSAILVQPNASQHRDTNE